MEVAPNGAGRQLRNVATATTIVKVLTTSTIEAKNEAVIAGAGTYQVMTAPRFSKYNKSRPFTSYPLRQNASAPMQAADAGKKLRRDCSGVSRHRYKPPSAAGYGPPKNYRPHM
jgi:hypothetical protein